MSMNIVGAVSDVPSSGLSMTNPASWHCQPMAPMATETELPMGGSVVSQADPASACGPWVGFLSL